MNDEVGFIVQVGSISHSYSSPFATQTARNPTGVSADFANVLATQSAAPTARAANFTALTADDRELIRVATGITLAPDGSVAHNATGEFPDWGTISQINDDRQYGQLKGPVTSTYIKDIIDRTPLEMQGGAHSRNLGIALDFLTKREITSATKMRIDIVA
jgi:hypothetical protein